MIPSSTVLRTSMVPLFAALVARSPRPSMYFYPADAESDCFARLIVCKNTNICGRRNPTHTPGYGWANKAVDCLSVLGPPGLELQCVATLACLCARFTVGALLRALVSRSQSLPSRFRGRRGPCFIRCSRGVNAQLVGNNGTVRSRPLFRLNNVEAVASTLEDELDYTVPPALVSAYKAYDTAQILLDDIAAQIEGISLSERAFEALDVLRESVAYIQRAEPQRTALLQQVADGNLMNAVSTASASAAVVASQAYTQRRLRGWRGTRWTESFYGSVLSFSDEATDWSSQPAAFAQPADPILSGTYSRGELRCVQTNERVLCGEWSEQGGVDPNCSRHPNPDPGPDRP